MLTPHIIILYFKLMEQENMRILIYSLRTNCLLLSGLRSDIGLVGRVVHCKIDNNTSETLMSRDITRSQSTMRSRDRKACQHTLKNKMGINVDNQFYDDRRYHTLHETIKNEWIIGSEENKNGFDSSGILNHLYVLKSRNLN